MLPNTINVEAGANLFLFSKTYQGPDSTTYTGPSEQGDLLGQPTLVIKHKTSNAGIETSDVILDMPVYDSAKGAYDGSLKVSTKVFRKTSHTIADVESILLGTLSILNNSAVLTGVAESTN